MTQGEYGTSKIPVMESIGHVFSAFSSICCRLFLLKIVLLFGKSAILVVKLTNTVCSFNPCNFMSYSDPKWKLPLLWAHEFSCMWHDLAAFRLQANWIQIRFLFFFLELTDHIVLFLQGSKWDLAQCRLGHMTDQSDRFLQQHYSSKGYRKKNSGSKWKIVNCRTGIKTTFKQSGNPRFWGAMK